MGGLPDHKTLSIVPIEAVVAGDSQVLAAREEGRRDEMPTIDLGVLADFPSVESVVASTRLEASRDVPHVKELLMCGHGPLPSGDALRHLTGLESLYALTFHSPVRLDLESLPAQQMRKLAVSRWLTKDLAPLERMTNLEKLKVDVFRDSLDPISRMTKLTYLRIKGPAKGWAKLRECAMLESAYFIDVDIANLRRWNTWSRLRTFTLSGRGVKSLAGLEHFERLEELILLNLRMDDLSTLRGLPRLHTLTCRMPAGAVDLESIATLPELRTLVIDDAAMTDSEMLRLPTLKPLAKASALEELTLLAAVEDGDLQPLMELPQLRKLKLGPGIGGDVELIRTRAEIQLDHTPPDPKWEKLKERVGAITIQRPGEGLEKWSIFESLAPALKLATNYAAESRIKREVKERSKELSKRLEWDTEAGGVGIYAQSEADIRAVAEIVNDLLRSASSDR